MYTYIDTRAPKILHQTSAGYFLYIFPHNIIKIRLVNPLFYYTQLHPPFDNVMHVCGITQARQLNKLPNKRFISEFPPLHQKRYLKKKPQISENFCILWGSSCFIYLFIEKKNHFTYTIWVILSYIFFS